MVLRSLQVSIDVLVRARQKQISGGSIYLIIENNDPLYPPPGDPHPPIKNPKKRDRCVWKETCENS